jgi:uncharacterized protein DUF4345
MKSFDLRHARTVALAGAGLTFGTIAILAIVAPHAVANEYGFTLARIEGMNEFRAVYTGFWLSLAIAMITAVRRPDVPLLGDICGAMLLLQATGRALSFGLDGRPKWTFVAAFVAELLSAITILALRKRAALAALPARAT